MLSTKLFNSSNLPSSIDKEVIINFLHENLEEYGDPKDQIKKAIDYALKEINSFGGFVLLALEDKEILGAVVINQTGMGGYIPENILVYIATSKFSRGKGVGSKLIEQTIKLTQGDIALHVEKDNPAKFLYEKFGFTNPYLEMRFKRKQ